MNVVADFASIECPESVVSAPQGRRRLLQGPTNNQGIATWTYSNGESVGLQYDPYALPGALAAAPPQATNTAGRASCNALRADSERKSRSSWPLRHDILFLCAAMLSQGIYLWLVMHTSVLAARYRCINQQLSTAGNELSIYGVVKRGIEVRALERGTSNSTRV